ncbi:MAG: AMP nucleosidase [Planctomycetota bacterium]
MTTPFVIEKDDDLDTRIPEACDLMEKIYGEDKCYPRVTVRRTWSKHNPEISGEMARPKAFRWYLKRELRKLARKGAQVGIEASRDRIDLASPTVLESVDEADVDLRQKKLFLFAPERIEVSLKRLEHYTGTRVEDFQRYILLTNYTMHMNVFQEIYPDCLRPERDVQMPAYHHVAEDNTGISIVNIGVGPSNAKTCTDHLAVLRPDALVMVGHCGGIRNHQEIGDFVLASGYMRADLVLDDLLPTSVPVAPSFLLNRYLALALDNASLRYRTGTVYTTADRNWEFHFDRTRHDLSASRSLAIDMESATVAANGFRYRIPNATLLCVSDKPLHGALKLPNKAREFYRESQRQHLIVATQALESVKADWPQGLPTSSIRALDEPLMGASPD